MSDPIAVAAAMLHEHGTMLLQRVIPPDALQKLDEYVQQSFKSAENADAAGSLTPEQKRFFDLNILVPGCLPTDEALTDIAEATLRAHVPGYVIEKYFGGPFRVHRKSVRARNQPPTLHRSHTPFHQDCSFLGHERVWINCWIPLTECGTHAPGLELYSVHTREEFGKVLPNSADAYPIAYIPPSVLIREIGSERRWNPKLARGDVLLFDSFVPHRTFTHPGMTSHRLSVEIRFGPI